MLFYGSFESSIAKCHVFSPLLAKTIHVIQSGCETLSSLNEAALFWLRDLYEKQYPFLCTIVLSAKPRTESELKVPYARRNNTTHHLPCTQHEPATSTVSKLK